MSTRLALPNRLMRIAPLEKVGDLLADAKFEPCGPVSGHDRLKHCSSLPDLIGRHLLVEWCGRKDLAHV
jgi:ribonucleoside-diphosphate reductase alpha chain